MQQKFKIVPKSMVLPLLLAVSFNMLTYYGSRLLTSDRFHYDLSNGLDAQIPVVPWTVTIYIGSYVLWIVNYILGCRQDKETAFRFISADFLAKFVCLLCFLLFPTTNVRPVINGDSIWDAAMRWLYHTDAADNLFPSIHCLTSWFCVIAVRKNKEIPVWYKAVSVIFAVSICISTLTTKQHVWIDVIGGIALAQGSYLFVQKSGFAKRYMDIIQKINHILSDLLIY